MGLGEFISFMARKSPGVLPPGRNIVPACVERKWKRNGKGTEMHGKAKVLMQRYVVLQRTRTRTRTRTVNTQAET